MKTLVSDFDNTLFTEDYFENIEKINEFVDKGNIFIIATGRNLSQLRKEIDKVNIKYSYLICNDGAIIFDKYLNLIKRIDINLSSVDKLIYELQNDQNVIETLVDDGINYFEHKIENNNAVLGRYIEPASAYKKVNKLMKELHDVQGYISSHWINIVNKIASKGNAVNYLSELLNIDKQAIYTVGDGFNDISMNEMFNGYYMYNNSHPKLIKVSKGSVKSVKELITIIE